MKKFNEKLREAALAYPEVTEDHPWGETVFKVKGKVFIFMGSDPKTVGFSVKLPQSAGAALMMPFAEPTHYGLGKHGWVSFKLTKENGVPIDVALEWLDESYRAVAPKKLLKALDEKNPPAAEAPKKKRKTS